MEVATESAGRVARRSQTAGQGGTAVGWVPPWWQGNSPEQHHRMQGVDLCSEFRGNVASICINSSRWCTKVSHEATYPSPPSALPRSNHASSLSLSSIAMRPPLTVLPSLLSLLTWVASMPPDVTKRNASSGKLSTWLKKLPNLPTSYQSTCDRPTERILTHCPSPHPDTFVRRSPAA